MKESDMGIRPINNILDQHVFRQEYNRLARMSVPAEYVKRCEIYGWYDSQNELHGGYALARGEVMAWPSLLQQPVSFFQKHDIKRCLEFNMAWAKGPLHDQCIDMIRFWTSSSRIIKEMTDIDYVTFAVDASYVRLVKLYERIATEVIFKGCVGKYPDREVIVFAAPRQRFENLAWIYIPEFFRRIYSHSLKKWRQTEGRLQLQTKEV